MATASISSLDMTSARAEFKLLTGRLHNGQYALRLLEKVKGGNVPFTINFDEAETKQLKQEIGGTIDNRYIVAGAGKTFLTHIFDPENNWAPGMTVIDTYLGRGYDGKDWHDIKSDHF